MTLPTPTPSLNSRIFQSFDSSFRDHVHQLIEWGFHDARPRIANNNEDEPKITSYIAEAIQDKIDYTNGIPWISDYSAQDGSKARKRGAAGNTKPMPDITIELCGTGPHPKYLFEAKRLRTPGFAVGKYVENGGLDCFTTGLYGVEYPEAGMLGYVQSHSIPHWKALVQDAINQKATKLELIPSQYDYKSKFSFPEEWISEHKRTFQGRPITIYHILLDCT